MAVDYFLQIDGIAGESTSAKHKGAIALLSWSWGETNAAPHGAGSGSGAGTATFQDLHFAAPVSKASPALFLACATGQHFKEAKLSAQRGAGKAVGDFLTWTFSDVLVTSYQSGGTESADAPPIDSVSLSFSKAQISYKAQRPDGSLDAPVTAGFDVKTHTKV